MVGHVAYVRHDPGEITRAEQPFGAGVESLAHGNSVDVSPGGDHYLLHWRRGRPSRGPGTVPPPIPAPAAYPVNVMPNPPPADPDEGSNHDPAANEDVLRRLLDAEQGNGEAVDGIANGEKGKGPDS